MTCSQKLGTFNNNTVWSKRYIEVKDFDLPDHIVRRALVDIPRDSDDGRVLIDDPEWDGIAV